MTTNHLAHCILLVSGFGVLAGPAVGADSQERAGGAASPSAALHERVNEQLGLASSRLVHLEVPDVPGIPVSPTITLDGTPYTIDLAPQSVRAADFQLLVQAADGSLAQAEPGPVRTLRGTVRGVPGSRASGSLLADGLHVMVDLGTGTRHWIEPIATTVAGADPDAYVVYDDDDVVSPGTCGDDLVIGAGGEPQGTGGGVAGTEECIYVAELACDSDHQYYLDHNSSVGDVEAEIESIINTLNGQYETQVQITHEITALIVRPFNDPYTGTTNPSIFLNEFQDYWESELPTVPRDVAQLFTGRDFTGSVIGIALTIGGICTQSGYCVSQDINNFSCRTDLSAHELGHLWGAGHCSCSDPPFTMNPVLTCANVFSQGSINSIQFHRDTRECLSNPCIPDNDYCSSFQFVDAGTTPFTTSGATTDGPGGLICDTLDLGLDVWFFYTAPCDGQATIDLCGSSFDTAVAVYDQYACPTTADQALTCSEDDGCGNQAAVTFDVSAGATYVIQVGSTTGEQGDGMLTITPPDCTVFPSNDGCGNPEPIGDEPVQFSTEFATTDGPAESCEGPIDNDVWFRFDPVCDDVVTVSLCGSDFDTRLAVYEAPCPGQPDLAIACSDDSDCGTASELQFVANSGTSYRIRVGGANGEKGTGTIDITCGANAPCPWDNNDDGQVNVDDLVNLIVAWGFCPGCAEDVNQDNEVNVDDLVELIVNWGPCP